MGPPVGTSDIFKFTGGEEYASFSSYPLANRI